MGEPQAAVARIPNTIPENPATAPGFFVSGPPPDTEDLPMLKNLRASLALGLLFLAAGITPALATPQYTATHRSAEMTDLVTAIGSTGYLVLLTGSAPASVATVDTGTVLVSLPLSSTAGTVSAGVLTFNAITTTAATATGTAAHFLICSTSSTANCVAVSSTTRVIQGSVSTSGADINLATTSIVSAANISVSSLTLTANGA